MDFSNISGNFSHFDFSHSTLNNQTDFKNHVENVAVEKQLQTVPLKKYDGGSHRSNSNVAENQQLESSCIDGNVSDVFQFNTENVDHIFDLIHSALNNQTDVNKHIAVKKQLQSIPLEKHDVESHPKSKQSESICNDIDGNVFDVGQSNHEKNDKMSDVCQQSIRNSINGETVAFTAKSDIAACQQLSTIEIPEFDTASQKSIFESDVLKINQQHVNVETKIDNNITKIEESPEFSKTNIKCGVNETNPIDVDYSNLNLLASVSVLYDIKPNMDKDIIKTNNSKIKPTDFIKRIKVNRKLAKQQIVAKENKDHVDNPVNITVQELELDNFEPLTKNKSLHPNRNVILKTEEPLEERPLRKWVKCEIEDSTFTIEEKYLHLFNNVNFSFNQILHFLLKHKYEFENNVCIIQICSSRTNMNNTVMTYAYCLHYPCSSFVFKTTFNENFASVKVRRSIQDLCHQAGVKLTSQMRNIDRCIMQKHTENILPFNMLLQNIRKSSKDICEKGNLQMIKSKTAMRKLNSQNKAKLDYTKDPFIDVYFMQQKHQYSYIQKILSPFAVYLYSKEVILELFKNKNHPFHTLHFDASGKFVAETENCEKRLLLYELIAHNSEKGVSMPVAGLISCRHRARDIEMFLLDFKYCCIENNVWKICKRICIDVSLALLIGINKAFNQIDSTNIYLEKCYEVVVNNSILDFIAVQYCVCHFSKIISNFIDSRTESLEVRKFFKEIMAYGLTINNITDLKKWWKCVIHIFENEQQNDNANQAFDNIRAQILLNNIVCEKENNDNIRFTENNDNIRFTETNDSDNDSSKSDYLKSPFYKLLNEMYLEEIIVIQNSNNTGCSKNPFFVENIAVEMNKKFGFCIPLWTNVVGVHVQGNTHDTISNAPAENWFKTLSKNVLLAERNLKPTRFIRRRQAAIQGLLKQFQIFPEKQTKMCSQKRVVKDKQKKMQTKLIENPIMECNVEETWDKPKPKKTTHQDYHWLKRNKALPSHTRNGSKRIKFDNELSEIPTFININSNIEAICTDFNENDEKVNTKELQLNNLNEQNKSIIFYDNGSVKNSNYYKKLASKQDIVIGSLKHLTDTAFGKTIVMNNLTTQEYNLFNPDVWLSTSSIEFVSAIIWSNSSLKLKTNVLSSNLGHYIFCKPDQVKNKEFYELLPNESDCWIIPFNLYNIHWVLAVVNFKLKNFLYLDPMGNKKNADIATMNTFVKFYKVINNSFTLKIQNIEYSKQPSSDSVNCGIFVLQYINAILNQRILVNLKNSNDYREECKQMLLENVSIDVCLYCQSEKSRYTSLCVCCFCKRFLCFKCNSSRFNFTCVLCDRFLNK